MSISSTTNKTQYTGNGVTTSFSFPYIFFATSDLMVTLFDTVANAAVSPAPVLNGSATYDYTVVGTLDAATGEYLSGANVVFNHAPVGNYRVTIERVVPQTQALVLIDNSKFPAASVNAAFDRLTILVQRALQLLGQALQIPSSDNITLNPLPPAATRANGYAGYDSSGQPTVFAGPASGVSIAAAMVAFVQSATLALGLKVLGGAKRQILLSDFGGVGDGVTTNDTAVANWWAAGMASPGSELVIDAGTFLCTGQVFWDCALRASTGVRVRGYGQNESIIKLSTTSSPAFKMYCSGGVSSSNQVNSYYNSFKDFQILCDTPNLAIQIGAHDFSSGIGSTSFESVSFLNNDHTSTAGAVAVEINQTFDVQWHNCIFDGKPHFGTALKLIGPVFNVFDGCSIGNCATAVYITAMEANAYQGFVYGNTFLSPDLENYTTGFKCDSANASKNVSMQGQLFSFYNDGFDISFSNGAAGQGNVMVFHSPNIAGGHGLDPSNVKGVLIRGFTQANFAQTWPQASTVAYTNVLGINLEAFIYGGTVTGITVNGFGPLAFTGGTLPVMKPGDTIAITYSVVPSVLFMPQV